MEERILSALRINGNASSESQSKSYIRLLTVGFQLWYTCSTSTLKRMKYISPEEKMVDTSQKWFNGRKPSWWYFVCMRYVEIFVSVLSYLITLHKLHYVSINLLEFFTKYRCVLFKIKLFNQSKYNGSPDLFRPFGTRTLQIWYKMFHCNI